MSIFTNASTGAADGAGDYIAAVLALVGDRDPVEILAELAPALAEVVAGVGAGDLRRAEAPGKWSMIEVLAHLADAELVWSYRLRLVLAEADPVLTGYDQDRWVEYLHYKEREVASVLEDIEFLRARNLRLIRSLGEEELERAGRHCERGRETVRHMLRLNAGHDLVHRSQLQRIRAAVVENGRVGEGGDGS